jgi:photosystem II stability/assembly factor-like uncharacterized protein
MTRLRNILSMLVLAVSASLASGQENVWVSYGPSDVGEIHDVAIGDSVAYAGTLNGVFRSRDRGETWHPSGLSGLQVDQIEARPGSPVVLAVGYRSSNFWDQSLYVSRDEGETWSAAPLRNADTIHEAIVAVIDAGHLSTIYAWSGGFTQEASFWKSTDAGINWQKASVPPPGGSSAFVRALASDSRAIFLLADGGGGLYRTMDGGESWATAATPVGAPEAIAAGAAPGVLYASTLGSFCRSTDSAATWTCSDGSYVPWILEVPGDGSEAPLVLVSNGDTVLVSRDFGATWASARYGLEGHPTALACDATGSLALVATNDGVFRSEDRGATWTGFRAGLQSVWIGALALDPQRPSTIWAGDGRYGSSHRFFRSDDAGRSWSPVRGPGVPVTAIAIEPERPSTMYVGAGGVFRSEDAGETWRSTGLYGVRGLALDSSAPGRIWAARIFYPRPDRTNWGLFRSDDGARTWQETSLEQGLYCLLYDQRHPGTIYGGSYDDIYYSYGDPIPRGGAIFVSRDNGETFTKISIRYGSQVKSIAADPFSDVIYAAGGSTILHGPSWIPRGEPLPGEIFQIVADPLRRGRLYCSTDAGVYRSTDAGLTWQPFSEGLASLHPGSLAISPDGRFLYAGTHGGGVFLRDLAEQTCSPSATRLCLAQSRYAVELLAGRRGEPPNTPGTARPLADRGGYFSLPFATGDAELPEVIVKVLGHGALGLDGSPIFYASLTTLPYVLTVTDTFTGEQETYRSDSAQSLCGAVDVAFEPEAAPAHGPPAVKSAAVDLRLLSGRFSVTLSARHPRTGAVTSGQAIASADRYGFFTFPAFTSDPTLPEVIVKMLDFRPINGQFLVFYTGLTSVDYTLTVTDSVTGATRTYESPGDYCGGVASDKFED